MGGASLWEDGGSNQVQVCVCVQRSASQVSAKLGVMEPFLPSGFCILPPKNSVCSDIHVPHLSISSVKKLFFII